MYSVYFRFRLANKKPKSKNEKKTKKWFGFASAPTKRQLFNQIDQFIDPYSVEVLILDNEDSVGYCYLAEDLTTFPEESCNEDEWDYYEVKRSKHEFSINEPVDDLTFIGWKKYIESEVAFDVHKDKRK